MSDEISNEQNLTSSDEMSSAPNPPSGSEDADESNLSTSSAPEIDLNPTHQEELGNIQQQPSVAVPDSVSSTSSRVNIDTPVSDVPMTHGMTIKRINLFNRIYRNQFSDSDSSSSDDGHNNESYNSDNVVNMNEAVNDNDTMEAAGGETSSSSSAIIRPSATNAINRSNSSSSSSSSASNSIRIIGPHEGSRRRPGNEIELRLSDMDSDTSSLPMHDDDEADQESSSDSSDFILEDLEDPAAVRSKKSDSNNDSPLKAAPSKKKKLESKLKQELPEVLKKPKPKHSWNGPRELFNRELGYKGNMISQTAEIFRSRFYGSLFSAERLELMKKLDGHSSCVNCLNFNYAGTKLASGSDDLTVKIWNYGLGKLITSFEPGHRANIFQAKFLPLIGIDNMIVSCARDNQVRLTELDATGEVGSSRKLAQHKGPAHKLAVHPDNPHIIFSCGEDSMVFSIDIREEHPQRILSVREKSHKVSLYSIHSNPLASYEFCVAGRDEYVRIYDARKLSTATVSQNRSAGANAESSNATSVRRFCPQHLVDSRAKAHVTAALYSYNGKEIIGSYNDENIYLFNALHSDMADCIKVYEGHRNSVTVKGVNFFGDRSQFVISGSDCGHIFIWDKETESIVNFFRGDENGVVNSLEPHPGAPILATSGLDDDVKIWIPSNEKPPKMGDLAATVRRNLKKRQEDLDDHTIDGQMMWALLNHMRQTERQRRLEAGDQSGSSSSSEDDHEDEGGFWNNDCCIS